MKRTRPTRDVKEGWNPIHLAEIETITQHKPNNSSKSKNPISFTIHSPPNPPLPACSRSHPHRASLACLLRENKPDTIQGQIDPNRRCNTLSWSHNMIHECSKARTRTKMTFCHTLSNSSKNTSFQRRIKEILLKPCSNVI
jgi:hypothetical protein